jgi:hypothetical protein
LLEKFALPYPIICLSFPARQLSNPPGGGSSTLKAICHGYSVAAGYWRWLAKRALHYCVEQSGARLPVSW